MLARQRGQLEREQRGGAPQHPALQQEFDKLLPLMPFLPTELGKHLQAMPLMGWPENLGGSRASRRSHQSSKPWSILLCR
jgi:hypothetical protein